MIDQMKAFARENNICVLATVSEGKPYCSLMAYVTDDQCKEIYMVTHRQTQKFKNLKKNPSVSLLIDTRETKPLSQAQALTIEGVLQKLNNENQKRQILAKLVECHPHLAEFIDHPDAEPLCIKINSFLLLNGLTQSYFEAV
ncbi:MAG: pyridoxamine 5'-phosphate oxidase family protein [Deltaproteobacteria bacterium]|nr:MAG: pyridoxamine 5'-phosphate oxidase family protein [Deltaproteobacteria bacterium]